MGVLASPKTLADRKLICDPCVNKQTLMGVDQCRLCGCLLSVKMRLKSAKCPIGKWGDK